MTNKLNLHGQRAALAWEAYQYYKHRLDTEPKYREQLRAELQARINASNQHNIEAAKKKGKRWDGVRWDEREFSGTYHLRGKTGPWPSGSVARSVMTRLLCWQYPFCTFLILETMSQ